MAVLIIFPVILQTVINLIMEWSEIMHDSYNASLQPLQ